MWWTCTSWSNVQKNISLAHIHQLHLAHIFGLLFFNQYACLNVSFRKISKVFISFLATKNMMLVSFLKIFAVKFLSYDTCIFLFYGNNENELSLSQNIRFFLYIAGFFFNSIINHTRNKFKKKRTFS